MGHTHNADAARGPVCSHMVTEAHFEAWGIVTEKTDHCVGTKVIVRPGMTAAEATAEAWHRGTVRICTRTPQVTPGWRIDPAHAAAAIEWVNENKGKAA